MVDRRRAMLAQRSAQPGTLQCLGERPARAFDVLRARPEEVCGCVTVGLRAGHPGSAEEPVGEWSGELGAELVPVLLDPRQRDALSGAIAERSPHDAHYILYADLVRESSVESTAQDRRIVEAAERSQRRRAVLRGLRAASERSKRVEALDSCPARAKADHALSGVRLDTRGVVEPLLRDGIGLLERCVVVRELGEAPDQGTPKQRAFVRIVGALGLRSLETVPVRKEARANVVAEGGASGVADEGVAHLVEH